MSEINLPEVVDESKNIPEKTDRTKQPATRVADFSEQIEKLMPLIGTIKLSEEEKDILYAPVDEGLIEIRPDGLVYLPWSFYITRMRQALGLEWALIPIGFPRAKGEDLVWPFWLIIRGIPVSLVMGEQRIANSQMTWSEQSEGAKSNALMRACKAIGICLQLWEPAFIRDWKARYATTIPDEKRPNKVIWIKKGTTVAEAVEKAQEIFPGSEVIPGKDVTGTGAAGPDGPITDGKSSALIFTDMHDELVRLNHLSVLRDWWLKHGEEAEKKLHPNHYKLLVELKTKLRQGFIDKANKKGGTQS